MVLGPSEEEHADVVDDCSSGPSVDGASKVPVTPVHTDSDSCIISWISFNCPSEDWSAVRIVTGLVPSDVLHWRLIDPGVEMSKRVSCGQEVPPDCDGPWVMSATV